MESLVPPRFPDVARLLPVRLERETPFKHRFGGTFLVAAFLLAVAVLIWKSGGATPGKAEGWVLLAVAGVFRFFGLLTVWSLVVTFFARDVPQTLVEIEEEPLRKGGAGRLAVIQPGPARLKSVQVSLACVERARRRETIGRSRRRNRSSRQRTTFTEVPLYEQVLLESGRVSEVRGGYWSETVSFSVPTEFPASTPMEARDIRWKITVQARVAGLISLSHAYVVKVQDA